MGRAAAAPAAAPPQALWAAEARKIGRRTAQRRRGRTEHGTAAPREGTGTDAGRLLCQVRGIQTLRLYA